MVTKDSAPVSDPEIARPPTRPRGPGVLRFVRYAPALAGVLLLLSLALPYWSLTLHAPQYPGGLGATIFTTHIDGDIDEIDSLNHYIGMMKLGDAARLERRMAPIAITAMALLALLATLVRSRWGILLELPVSGFPIVFAANLYYWLHRAGHELDPHAALSSSVKPFTPAILGVGKVGQFSTSAMFEPGFFLALLAAGLVITSAYFRLKGERR